jgi:sugar phosphate isomerase/epimerase
MTVWRDTLVGRDIAATGRMLRDHGLSVVSLCRGGFFPALDSSERRKAIDENRRAIEEAKTLGAPLIVLVCGSIPGQPLPESRKQIADGIAALLPDCQASGVKLAVEPLHPMYADSRSAINTLGQANDLVESLGAIQVGVAVDVYHVWWDPALEKEIARAGKLGALFAYHLCDWRTPTVDMLNDRGLMGEGCIPLRQIRTWMQAAGFKGFNEVEIFSNRLWSHSQDEFLADIVQTYRDHV